MLQKPGGNDAPNLRKIQGKLRPMLGNWGLLKGQVEPALQILEAMRPLLKQGLKQSRVHNLNRTGKAPRPGTREAWQLLALLREVLGLPAKTPETALREMAALPVLPIFDHMPRRTGPRRHSSHPKGGPATVATSSDKQPAGASASRRRRRSRRPRRERNQAQV